MAGRRIIYLISLAGCLVFYCFYREWLSWLFLMCVLMLPALSLLVSLPAILQTRLRMDAPYTVAPGQDAKVILRNASPMAVPFRCALRVKHAVTGKSLSLRSGAPLPTEVCGKLTVQVIRPRICDYLGLFRLPAKKISPAEIYIWPQAVPLSPEPEFAREQPRQWRPKPGGGFAENHDLRLYRPGDNLQQIHWKLSAKTGNLILREAMVPVRRPIRLTLDLWGDPQDFNRKLGRLLWLSQLLVKKERSFQISALTGRGILTWQVDTEESLQNAMKELLSAPAAEGGSLADIPAPACHSFHIGGAPDED